ncbi:MAG: hypothetical protein ACOCVC_07690 [Spirochaeta sp.]
MIDDTNNTWEGFFIPGEYAEIYAVAFHVTTEGIETQYSSGNLATEGGITITEGEEFLLNLDIDENWNIPHTQDPQNPQN